MLLSGLGAVAAVLILMEARLLGCSLLKGDPGPACSEAGLGGQKERVSAGKGGHDGLMLPPAPSLPSPAFSALHPKLPTFPASTSPAQNPPQQVWPPREASPDPRHQVAAGTSHHSSPLLTRASFMGRWPMQSLGPGLVS